MKIYLEPRLHYRWTDIVAEITPHEVEKWKQHRFLRQVLRRKDGEKGVWVADYKEWLSKSKI